LFKRLGNQWPSERYGLGSELIYLFLFIVLYSSSSSKVNNGEKLGLEPVVPQMFWEVVTWVLYVGVFAYSHYPQSIGDTVAKKPYLSERLGLWGEIQEKRKALIDQVGVGYPHSEVFIHRN
jgi:hypothetical protein